MPLFCLTAVGVKDHRAQSANQNTGSTLIDEVSALVSTFKRPQGQLPDRSEIPEEYKWRLEDIYPDLPAWEQDFSRAREKISSVTQFAGRLSEGGATLAAALEAADELEAVLERLYAYARMRRDEDNANATYQALADRSQTLWAEASAATAYLVPEILGLPEERLAGFLKDTPFLSRYRFALAKIMRQKPHTLSREEETILAQSQLVAQGPADIFTMLNDADLRFGSIKNETGEDVEVTKGRFVHFLESQDRRVRRDAFAAVYGTYRSFRHTLAATFNASVKTDVFYARVRRYGSAREMALYPNNIPLKVYDQLVSTVNEHLPLLHRYMSTRRRLLGLDRLHAYDLYVPLLPDLEIDIPFEEAKDLVVQSVAPLGPAYQKAMAEGLESRWVDVYENRGKTAGAYSWGAYGVHPYVLLNYVPGVSSLFTLAHELGHAMHTYYTYEHQPHVYADYATFVAEVASTCHEALLAAHLFRSWPQRQKRLYLVNHQLEQFRTTLFRQTMFAEFEKIVHEQVESGQALTADMLGQIYHDLNVRYYGPEVEVDPELDLEWARIPHFYNAFYVYQYATGFSAAMALARAIQTEGDDAAQRYLGFLQAGGSDYPIAILQRAGVDMTKPDPVVQALDVMKRLLDELAEMPKS